MQQLAVDSNIFALTEDWKDLKSLDFYHYIDN